MKINVSHDVQPILDQPELTIITERVDDVALLIEPIIRMGYPALLDQHIPKQGQPREWSWGWTATIWLAYLISEGDHRKVSVAQDLSGMRNTLNAITRPAIDALDFDDDRLCAGLNL